MLTIMVPLQTARSYVFVCLTNSTILSAELARFSSSSFTFFRRAIRSVTSARIHSERFFACSFNSSAVKPIASPPSVGRREDFLPTDLFRRRRGALEVDVGAEAGSVIVVMVDVADSLESLASAVDVVVVICDDCAVPLTWSEVDDGDVDLDVDGGVDSTTADTLVISVASFMSVA